MIFVIKAFVSLLIVVNPLDAVSGYFALTAQRSVQDRLNIARTAAIAMTLALLAAVWLGELLLNLFNISLGAFQVGGGLVILLMAVSMLHARTSALSQTAAEADEAAGREDVAIVPLAIPLMAGPAAISMAVVIANQAGGVGGRVVLSIVVAGVGFAIWWILKKAQLIDDYFGVTGVNVTQRVAGLILAAIGVQIIANGLIALFPGLG